jgi:uncharacterized SAM-binding protein YcdF (DUF218 family)
VVGGYARYFCAVTVRRFLFAAAATGLVILLVLAGDFRRRMDSAHGHTPIAHAVVFTGHDDRIQQGLAFLEHGQIGRLLVSGIRSRAALTPQRFVERFVSDSSGLDAALEEERLYLGFEATNTFGNARETACWYRREGLSGPILLITSRIHMPRASLVLGARLPGVEIRRHPVITTSGDPAWWLEFSRYLATWVLLIVDPRHRTTDCPAR